MHVRCYLLKLPGNPILVITSLVFQYFRATSHNVKKCALIKCIIKSNIFTKNKTGTQVCVIEFLLKCNFEKIKMMSFWTKFLDSYRPQQKEDIL